jgi:hypothetical protein
MRTLFNRPWKGTNINGIKGINKIICSITIFSIPQLTIVVDRMLLNHTHLLPQFRGPLFE